MYTCKMQLHVSLTLCMLEQVTHTCLLLTHASRYLLLTIDSACQELNTSSMVNVVWALAKTDYEGNGNRRTRTLLDNIAKSAMSQMDCFTPEQLSRLLWAFSTLHHWHEELYDAVAAETLRQVRTDAQTPTPVCAYDAQWCVCVCASVEVAAMLSGTGPPNGFCSITIINIESMAYPVLSACSVLYDSNYMKQAAILFRKWHGH